MTYRSEQHLGLGRGDDGVLVLRVLGQVFNLKVLSLSAEELLEKGKDIVLVFHSPEPTLSISAAQGSIQCDSL